MSGQSMSSVLMGHIAGLGNIQTSGCQGREHVGSLSIYQSSILLTVLKAHVWGVADIRPLTNFRKLPDRPCNFVLADTVHR